LGEQKGMEILKGKGNRRGLEEYNIIRRRRRMEEDRLGKGYGEEE